ncbi:MAG: hypothetical protein AAF437_12365 [Pseudomonadota bacterium]
MKPMISSLSAFAAMVIATAPAASALTCAEQAADLQKQQVKAQKIADARLALVDQVEAAGDAWENAEAMRNFSKDQAAEADATKVAYDALKSDLMVKEQSLQSLVISLNQGVTAYNERCVKD